MLRETDRACWGAPVTVRAWAVEPEYRRIVLRPPAGGVFAVRCLRCAVGWYLACTGLSLGDELGCVLLLLLMGLLWPVSCLEAGLLQLRMTPHLARQVDLFRGLQEGLLPREAPLLLILHGIVGVHGIHRPGSSSSRASARGLACNPRLCEGRPWLLWQAACHLTALCPPGRQLRGRLREEHVRGRVCGGVPPCSSQLQVRSALQGCLTATLSSTRNAVR